MGGHNSLLKVRHHQLLLEMSIWMLYMMLLSNVRQAESQGKNFQKDLDTGTNPY
jgi:hypothetical protein